MAGHLVPLAAFLAQALPQPAILHKHVLGPHRQRRADPREAVDHQPDQRPVAQARIARHIDPVEQRARFCRS